MGSPDEDPFDRAARAHAEGRLEEAASQYQACLQSDPEDAVAMALLGAVQTALGHPTIGLRHLEDSIGIDPENPIAWLHLGATLAALALPERAISAFEEALRLEPSLTEARLPLASCHASLGRHDEAIRIADASFEDHTDSISMALIGIDSLLALGHEQEAERRLRSLNEKRPRDPSVMDRLAALLVKDPDPVRRLEGLHARAIARPVDVSAITSLAMALGKQGRLEDCAECWRRAVALRPSDSGNHFELGKTLAVLGRIDEASTALEESIALDPGRADAWLTLATIHRFTSGDPLARRLCDLEAATDLRRHPDARNWHYALAKMYDDLGDYDRAFAHFDAGAMIVRAGMAPDLQPELDLMDAMRRGFKSVSRPDVKSVDRSGHHCIFVVGMPRSGTTLVEQILASHHEVFGAGELPAARDAADAAGIAQHLGSVEPSVPMNAIRRFGEEYLHRIPKPPAPMTLICDKQPLNFRLLGLIASGLPESRLVHVQRDVRDIGLSCFQALFAHHRWSFDLREIAAYINGYRALMDHWRRCLGDRLVTVRYESLVGDPEAEIRTLLEALDLAFDAQCLRPQDNTRAVNTASIAQVRRSINASSVGRWRRYESHLAPMIEMLGDLRSG